MRTIEIGGKTYEVRMTWAALYAWEIGTDRALKTFRDDRLFDRSLMMLCMLNGANPAQPMTWEEWQKAIDADPTLVTTLTPLYIEAWTEWQGMMESKGRKKNEEGA